MLSVKKLSIIAQLIEEGFKLYGRPKRIVEDDITWIADALGIKLEDHEIYYLVEEVYHSYNVAYVTHAKQKRA